MLAAAPAPPAYHIDLTQYFPTEAAEQTERTALLAETDAFVATHPAPHDPAALESYLHHAETLLARASRHEQYFEVKVSLDLSDRAAETGQNDMAAQGDRVTAALETTALHLAPGEFEADVKSRPNLGPYAFEIGKFRRNVAYTLPQDQQLVLDQIALPSLSALWKLYQQTIRSTEFGRVAGHDMRADRRILAADPDPTIRAQARHGWLAGYASREPIYAGILLDVVDTRNRMAKLAHFPGAPAQQYFVSFLTVDDVKATLAAVKGHADLNRHYQAMSRTVPPPAPFTIEQTRMAADQALQPLGADYVGQFDTLLDPKNGRADIGFGGANRDSGGFSIGSVGAPSMLFVGNFQGRFDDANVVIHEGGHAVHRALMSANQVSPFYGTGPHWMFEAFAILNQMLLDDAQYRASTDPQAKAYYLNELVKEMMFQIFTSAEEGALEQAIYDAAAADTIKDGAGLDALTLSIVRDYEGSAAAEPDQGHLWMTKSLMFEDPLYLVNYLYAGLLATKLYEMATDDPADFQRRYLALLSNGFYAPPDELLGKFFGHRVTTTDLVPGAMAIVTKQTDALQNLYMTLDAARTGGKL